MLHVVRESATEGPETTGARSSDGHPRFPFQMPPGVSVFKYRNKARPEDKWHVAYRYGGGKRRVITASTDVRETLQIAREMLANPAAPTPRQMKVAPPEPVAKPKPALATLLPSAKVDFSSGVIDLEPRRARIQAERNRPINEHLADYRLVLQDRGDAQNVRDVYRRVRVMLRLCRIRTFGELENQPSKIIAARQKLRSPRPMRPKYRQKKTRHTSRSRGGAATVNHYINALKSFCNWMLADARADFNPSRNIKSLRRSDDVRRQRRALTAEEIARLVDATRKSRPILLYPRNGSEAQMLSPNERALTYLLAATAGLRVKEIRSLNRDSFTFGPSPQVRLQGAYTKNRKTAVLPLRKEVAALLQLFLDETDRQRGVLRIPANNIYALKKDLAAAGIPYHTSDGFADFHALRHSFCTNLVQSGATAKEAQVLARHHTAALTLAVYAHLSEEQKRAAIDNMAAIEKTPAEPAFRITF